MFGRVAEDLSPSDKILSRRRGNSSFAGAHFSSRSSIAAAGMHASCSKLPPAPSLTFSLSLFFILSFPKSVCSWGRTKAVPFFGGTLFSIPENDVRWCQKNRSHCRMNSSRYSIYRSFLQIQEFSYSFFPFVQWCLQWKEASWKKPNVAEKKMNLFKHEKNPAYSGKKNLEEIL